MKLSISGIQIQGELALPGFVSTLFAARYKDQYKPIVQDPVGAVDQLPKNISIPSGSASFDLGEQIRSVLNSVLCVDLLGVYNSSVKGKEEYVCIPLCSSAIELGPLLLRQRKSPEVCSHTVQWELDMREDYLVSAYPGLFSDKMAAWKAQLQATVALEGVQWPEGEDPVRMQLSVQGPPELSQEDVSWEAVVQISGQRYCLYGGETVGEKAPADLMRRSTQQLQTVQAVTPERPVEKRLLGDLGERLEPLVGAQTRLSFPERGLPQLGPRLFQAQVQQMVQGIARLFAPAPADSQETAQATPKSKKEQRKPQKQQVEVPEDAFECFCATMHCEQAQNPLWVLLKRSDTHATLLVQPAVRNYKAEAAKAQKSGGKNTAFAVCFGISRASFADPAFFDAPSLSLCAEFPIGNLLSKATGMASGILFPFEPRVFTEISSGKDVPAEDTAGPAKAKQPGAQGKGGAAGLGNVGLELQELLFQDGKNQIVSNQIAGLAAISQKLEKIHAGPQQPPLRISLLHRQIKAYQKGKTDPQAARELISAAYKLGRAGKLFYSGSSAVVEAPGYSMRFSAEKPVTVQKIRGGAQQGSASADEDQVRQCLAKDKDLMERVRISAQTKVLDIQEPTQDPGRLLEKAKDLYQVLETRLFLETRPQMQREQSAQFSLAEQRLQQKLHIQKTYSLRGLPGKIQARQALQPKIQAASSGSIMGFLESSEGSGILGVNVNFLEQEMQRLAGNGFPSMSSFCAALGEASAQAMLRLRFSGTGNVFQQTQSLKNKRKGSAGSHGGSHGGSCKNLEAFQGLQKGFQLDRHRILRQIQEHEQQLYQLTATNVPRYLGHVQRLFYNFLQAYLDFRAFSAGEFVQFCVDAGIQQTVSNYILCLLVAGLRLAQPMEFKTLQDMDVYYENISKPLAFVEKILGAENWEQLISGNCALLVLTLKASEHGVASLRKTMEAARDADAAAAAERLTPVPATHLKLELWYYKLLRPVLRGDAGFTHKLLWRSLNCGDAVANETKQEVLQRLIRRDIRRQDAWAIFELIDLPGVEFLRSSGPGASGASMQSFAQPQNPQPQSASSLETRDHNLFLETTLKLEIDETGKRIKTSGKTSIEQLLDAKNQALDVSVQQVSPHIIGAFLFLLWKLNLVAVDFIDRIIVEEQIRLIQQAEASFREEFQALITVPSDAEQTGAVQASQHHPGPEECETSTQFMRGHSAELLALGKLLQARGKPLLCTLSTAHQSAIQQILIQAAPDFGPYLFRRQSYQSDEAFMLAVLDNGMYKASRNVPVQRSCLLLSLAEYLVQRNEKTFAKEAVRVSKTFTKQIQPDLIQHQTLRAEVVELKTLLLEGHSDQVQSHLDGLVANAPIFQRLRGTPAYGYLRAMALSARLQEAKDALELKQLKEEVCMYCFQSLIQLQKVKEYDEVSRGSTGLGDAGFYDLQYGYQILELLVMNSQILIRDNALGASTARAADGGPGEVGDAFAVLGEEGEARGGPEQAPGTTVSFLRQFPGGLAELQEEDYDGVETHAERPAEVPKETGVQQSPREGLKSQLQSRKAEIRQGKQSVRQEAEHMKAAVQQATQQGGKQQGRSGDMPSAKDLLKQTLTLCSTAKQITELHPTFGPCWALYALVQLAMNNGQEARLSGSLATLMSGSLVESWIAWYVCESSQGNTARMRWIQTEFAGQIEAMGAATGPWSRLWKSE